MRTNKAFFIKLFHSIVFVFMVLCLLYILYCGITRTYNRALLFALGAIFLEGLALMLNHWQCPLTTLAHKHGAINGAVTDIFLPGWLARHTFKVSTVIFVGSLILLATGYFFP